MALGRTEGTVLGIDIPSTMLYHIDMLRYNDTTLDTVVLFGKALGDAGRLRVLHALRQSDLCVCELTDALEMSQSTLSSHLQVLRHAGLVTTHQVGKWRYYALHSAHTAVLHTVLTHFAPVLDADPRVARDAARLAERLALREGGRCVLGALQLDTVNEGGETR